jgi:hypothetical protein
VEISQATIWNKFGIGTIGGSYWRTLVVYIGVILITWLIFRVDEHQYSVGNAVLIATITTLLVIGQLSICEDFIIPAIRRHNVTRHQALVADIYEAVRSASGDFDTIRRVDACSRRLEDMEARLWLLMEEVERLSKQIPSQSNPAKNVAGTKFVSEGDVAQLTKLLSRQVKLSPRSNHRLIRIARRRLER